MELKTMFQALTKKRHLKKSASLTFSLHTLRTLLPLLNISFLFSEICNGSFLYYLYVV